MEILENSNPELYRVGVIGAGSIGSTHIDVLATNKQAQLVAICDSDRALAQQAAQRAGSHAYTSVREMCFEEQLDGAILCTPPSTHHGIVEELLGHGVDVLCEKPFATDGKLARHMVQTAKDAGRLIMLASKFRYVEDIRWARDVIRSGQLGTILHAEIVFTSSLDMKGRWHVDRSISGGGVVIDNGSHAVDLCRYLFGSIESIMGVAYARGQDLPVEDSACLFITTEDNTGVTVDVSWSFQRDLPYFVRVHGTEANLSVGWKESSISGGSAGFQTLGTGYSKTVAFAAVHDDFIRASRGIQTPLIDSDDAIAAVDAIDAAYRSMEDGRMTNVGLPENILS
jgi:predicted dehydrogenase